MPAPNSPHEQSKKLAVAESKASTTIKLLQMRCGFKKVKRDAADALPADALATAAKMTGALPTETRIGAEAAPQARRRSLW